MFGGNSFGLSMDDASDAGPSTQLLEGEEVDVEWLRMVKTNHDVNVKVSEKISLDGLPQHSSLLAVSNRLGLLIVGSSSDIRIHRLQDIHRHLEEAAKDASPASAPICVLPLPARPAFVRLASGESRLVVATVSGGGVFLWKLEDVLAGDASPYHAFPGDDLASPLDVLPNPAAPSATDSLSHYVAFLSEAGCRLVDIERCHISQPLPANIASASWSAKGKQLVCGTRDGKMVQFTPEGVAKAEIPAPPELDAAASFCPASIQWLENDLFLVCYASANAATDEPLEVFIIHRNKGAITYTKFFDPVDTMGVPGRSGSYRHYASLGIWGERTRHLTFMTSGLASEIAVMNGEPAPDKAVPKWQVCILEETARAIMPTGKPGISDDTSCLGLALDLTCQKPVVRGVVGGVDMPDLPPPPRVLAYSQEGFLVSFDVQYEGAPRYPGMVAPQETTAATPDAMDVGPTPPVTTPAAELVSGSSTTGGLASTTPAGTPVKASPFQSSAFGGPAFGQSASPATAPSTTPSTTPAKAPAFGFNGFGQASSTTPASSPGPSAFGSSNKPAAFGQTAFGQSSTPSAFGKSAFGQTAAPTAFGSSTTPAFGQTGFGQSAFGQPSTPSAFGQTSKPAPSAFGSPASSSLGFGAFGAASTQTAPTNFSFKPSASAGNTSVDTKASSSPFGSGGGFGGSAFGQSSAFGAKSGFGSKTQEGDPKPAFAGFGPKPPPSVTPTPPLSASISETDDFGLGGFGSALETSSNTKPTVPGLDDSPPASPVSNIPRRAPGLDDSPPNSPPHPPPAKLPSAHQTQPTSSFIKPATAFSQQTTSFGAFGSTNKAPAFGSNSSSTPAALSAAPTPASAAPSASPAFGQSSAISVPKTGFGSSGFAQSSVPKVSAFGATSSPSATPAFGGFGAFSAKPAQQASESSNTAGGFGGFAAKSSGASAFGASSTQGSSFASLLSSSGSEKAKETTKSIFAATPAPNFSFKKPPPDGIVDIRGYDVPSTAPTTDPPQVKQEPVSPPASTPGQTTPSPEKLPQVAHSPAPSDPSDPSTSTSPAAALPEPEVEELPDEPHSPHASQPEAEPTAAEVTTAPSASDEEEDHEDEEYSGEVADEDADYEEVDHADWDEYEQEAEDEEDYEEEEGDDIEAESEPAESAAEPSSTPSLLSRLGPAPSPEAEVKKEPSPSPEPEPLTAKAVGFGDSLPTPSSRSPEKKPSSFAGFGNTVDPKSNIPIINSITSASAQTSSTSRTLFSGFGIGQKDADKTASAPASSGSESSSNNPASTPATSSFGGFGRLASTTSEKSVAEPPLPATPAFGSGGAAGQPSAQSSTFTPANKPTFALKHAAKTSSPLGTHPPQSANDRTSPEKPAAGLFSGLGLGRPSGAAPGASSLFEGPQSATPVSKPGSSFFSFDTTSKPPTAVTPAPSATPTSKPTSLFPSIDAAAKPQTAGTPVQSAPQPKSDTFTTPPRPAGIASPSRPTPKTDSLSVIAEHLLVDLRGEMDNLRHILETCKQFHKSVIEGNMAGVTLATLNKHEQLPLSTVPDIQNIVDGLKSTLVGLGKGKGGIDGQVSRLESGMLKFDLRTGQIEQYLRTRKDSNANSGVAKNLNPRQADLKTRVEQSEAEVQSLLSDLNGMIKSLRETASLQGPSSDGSSAIDRIGRSVKTVESAVKSRQATVEQLSARVAGMRLSSPAQQSRGTSSTPAPQVGPRADISLEAPERIKRDIQRALSGENGQKNLAKRLARFSKNMKVRIVNVDGHGIKLDSVPLPGARPSSATPSPSPSVEVKTEPPTSPSTKSSMEKTESVEIKMEPVDIPLPTETHLPALSPARESQGPSTPASNGFSATSSSGFGGLKFSFDLPKTDLISPTSRQHGAGRVSGHSHKAHESAPRYQASSKAGEPTTHSSGNVSADSPVRMPGGDFFTFTPKAPEGGKDAPKGFFSLSGFEKTS